MLKGNKIVLVLGLITLAAGIFVFSREFSFRKKAVQTEGVVVSTIGSTFNVQYFTADGTEKVKRFSAKSNPYRAGDPKNVWYLPENPDRAKLTNDTKGGKTLLKVAFVCLLLGVYPLFIKKKVTEK
ncbi:MAG TPA: hypothetical protein DER09_07295 [Prolixibacteraceae bacterium]|nr:hypothetical protein [Prolixibacteraceae bacterium]